MPRTCAGYCTFALARVSTRATAEGLPTSAHRGRLVAGIGILVSYCRPKGPV
ncbi:hypothetical protein [Wenjunlia tyrosinilytica]|uniref:hypothetical protein n=1 Tax=Wenjunlia tyrosinilytica TaxID=1544741 RepID=UPI00166556F7|nr:hypothetical protein [Wenjunlia tyrosinilytica]